MALDRNSAGDEDLGDGRSYDRNRGVMALDSASADGAGIGVHNRY